MGTMARRYKDIPELRDLVWTLDFGPKLANDKVNKVESFSFYEKLRYFFVPFFEVPEMESRLLEEFTNRVEIARQLRKREIPTTDIYGPTTVAPSVAPTTQSFNFSVYDAFDESSWDNFDWFNITLDATEYNECGVESATTTKTRKYAEKLGALRKELSDLSLNELYVLRMANKPERLSKRSVSEGWNWYSYLAIVFAMWAYPVICDAEKQYYYEAVIADHKQEIKNILRQPALEALIDGTYNILKKTKYDSEPNRTKRQTHEFESISADMNLFLGASNEGLEKVIHSETFRPKRGILAQMVGEITSQTVGVLTGNIVSNLITTGIDLINPYSSFNRLNRMEEAYDDMKRDIGRIKQLNKGILDTLDKLSNVVQETVERIDEHVKAFPEYTWLSSLIVNRIAASALDLQRVTDEAKRGRIACEPFARLTGLSFLKYVDSRDTELLSVSRINDHAINIKFRTVIESPDTHVERIRAFKHWDNLDETPRLLKYVGAEYVIRNESSNCIKALSSRPERYVNDQCIEDDGEDPAVAQWDTVVQTDDIHSYANESDAETTLAYSYVYCFPGNITIEKELYRCPNSVFKLKSRLKYVTGKRKHTPIPIAIDTSQDLAIETVHAGHFRDDSDVIQKLALFDQLRNKTKQLKDKNEEIDNSIVVRKYGPAFWSILTFAVATTCGGVAYVAVQVYMRLPRKRKARFQTNPTVPTQPPTNPITHTQVVYSPAMRNEVPNEGSVTFVYPKATLG
jgi:hypothetical protein